jgi:transcriptional regulator with XRE-family HTH domain
MILTPRLCRTARAGLNWSQADLAQRCRVSLSTIMNFERRVHAPHDSTLANVQGVLERAGVQFVSERTLTLPEES